MRSSTVFAVFVIIIAINGIVTVANAVSCCNYYYKLRIAPGETGNPSCSAFRQICQCEDGTNEATEAGGGKIAITSRRAICHCYYTTSPSHIQRAACNVSLGPEWVKLQPPMPDGKCCWIRYPSEQVTMTPLEQDFSVLNCNGNPCP